MDFQQNKKLPYLKYHEKAAANIWVLRTKIVANIWIPPKIVANIWILRKSGSRPRPCRWSCPRCQGLLWEGGVRVHILSCQKYFYSKKEGCIDRFQFWGPFVLCRSWQMKSILSVLHQVLTVQFCSGCTSWKPSHPKCKLTRTGWVLSSFQINKAQLQQQKREI